MTITGRVQGVFFRATTQQKALELGVNGWVKNTVDGCVEVHIEGEENAVEKLVEWCKHGPDTAVVTNIDIRDCQSENCTSFEVIR